MPRERSTGLGLFFDAASEAHPAMQEEPRLFVLVLPHQSSLDIFVIKEYQILSKVN
jgi:hypothetical protein